MYKILLSYIKDLSVETPNAETLIYVKDKISSYNLGIEIKSKALKNKMVEVSTKLSFLDKDVSEKKSIFELDYATIVKFEDEINDKKILEKILLCDVQNSIYPKLEKIFTNLINDAGYPGVKFDKKINFEKLYNERVN